MKSKKLRYNAMLVLAAFIWGSAFVAQSVGTNYVRAFTFQSLRSILACAVLLPVIFFSDHRKQKRGESTACNLHELIKGSVVCGIIISISAVTQQYGIAMTTVGKAGFLTAMYILIVPVLGLFFHKKVPTKLWFCILVELIGLYFLCINEQFILAKGDFFEILCALSFSFHILAVDHYCTKVDPIKLSFLQFLVSFIVCGIFAIIFDPTTWADIVACAIPLLYLGVLSGGVAFTLQIVAQKQAEPTIASLLMSLESVFSLVSGMIVLHEIPSTREAIGCILMFGAIVFSQLPERKSMAKA